MLKASPSLSVILILGLAGAVQAQDPVERLAGPVPDSAALFAPGVISTDLGERDASFHPNGREFYFSLWTGRFGTIMTTRFSDAGGWSEPQTTSFSGRHSDLEPFVAPDGSRLFFASNRPVDAGAAPGDYNVWYVNREGDGWSEPMPLTSVNTTANEYYPSVDTAGTLYWTAAHEDGLGGEDIYYAVMTDTGYSARINAGSGVNTERDEFNAMIAPNGSWLAFGSFGREDGTGGGDLYISFRQEDGALGPAVNMGAAINTPALDFCPALTPDGRGFLFSSRRTMIATGPAHPHTYEGLADALRSPGNGRSDIYWISSTFIHDLRRQSTAD